MGSTSFKHRGATTREAFAEHFAGTDPDNGFTMLDSALANGVAYGALKVPSGKVVAVVSPYKRDKAWITFKEQDEFMGPYDAEAPQRILDLLSPLGPDDEWAAQWRAKCEANLAKPKPKPGDTVTFDRPIEFTNGDLLSEFTFKGGSKFTAAPETDDNFYQSSRRPEGFYATHSYTITGWRRMAYEVTPAEPVAMVVVS